MKNLTPHLIITVSLLFSCSKEASNKSTSETFTVTEFNPVSVVKSESTPVLVHYMPWFESPEFAEFPNNEMGGWGQHWTMTNQNPEIITDGKRQIASHFYPMIGPYDNGEPDYLEYAVVCMKLTGVEGAIIDFPCNTPVYDWKLLFDHTMAMLPYLEKAGLKVAISYEDVALKNAYQQGIITNIREEGLRVMNYMQENIFSRSNYFRLDNKPILLNFGPQALFTDEDWKYVFSEIPEINFFPLAYHGQNFNLTSSANGAFAWVGETMSDFFYQFCDRTYTYCIGGAMPEFKDYYLEGGWGNGFTEYDNLNEELLPQTLARAKANNSDIIQIITWNDFNEGTMVEPTLEFGFSRLNQIQKFTGVNYGIAELELAVTLYQKRKEHKGKLLENKKLDQVFNYLISLQLDEARGLLDTL